MLNGSTDSGVSNRRLQSRLPVSALTCVELGEANGGIVLNISEGGVALTAAMKLPSENLTRLRIQLPKSRKWIDVNGQICWKSESRKKAGFRFVDLSEGNRKQIEEWIYGEASPRGMEGKTATGLGETRKPPRELRPLSENSLMPSLLVPGRVGERQIRPAMPAAEPIALQPVMENVFSKPLPVKEEARSDPQEDAGEDHSNPDQRLYERQPVRALTFMKLGESNGGVILDISEGGVSVRAAVALADENLPRMRFQLPPDRQWIEASGRVVRLDESRTLAGIEFRELTREASMKISEWILAEASRNETSSETPTVVNKTARLLETLAVRPQPVERIPQAIPALPSIPAAVAAPAAAPMAAVPEMSVARAIEAPAPAPQKTPVVARAAVPATGLAIVPAVRKPPQMSTALEPRIKPHLTPASVSKRPGVGRPTWSTLALAVGLAVLISSAGAWFLAERVARNTVMGMLGKAQPGKTEPAQSTQASPRAESASAASLPVVSPPMQTNAAPPSAGSKTAIISNLLTKAAPARGHAPDSIIPSKAAIAVERQPAQPPAPPAAQKLENNSPPTKEIAVASANPVAKPQAVAAETVAEPKQVSMPAAKPAENTEIFKGAVSVSYSPYPSIRIPPELKSQASRLGASLQIGQVISRVDPVYPEDAERQRIEGTVKLHVMIDREGTVQNVQVINGPQSLAPAAVSALQLWRYKQTLFGGQPIEAEEDVTVTFRMKKQNP